MRDLATLPKAHLHVHLESTVRADTLAELAEHHGVDVPAVQTGAFDGFAQFAAHNGAVRDCLRRAEDFRRIAYEFCAEEAAQGTRYAEVTFTAAAHGERLGDPDMPLEAVLSGLAAGQAAHGIECRVIVDHPRKRSVARLRDSLRLATAHPQVVAIGTAGAEDYPLTPFAGVFRAARDGGVGLVHHAGECCGAPSVAEAVTVGLADRIGHGFRALDDPEVVALLRDRAIPLEACPSSNVALGLVESLSSHPLPLLIDAGLTVTLSTDIPASTGTTLTDEYRLLREHLGFGDDALARIATNAVDASFAPEDTKTSLRQDIAAWRAGSKHTSPCRDASNATRSST
ncbi:adenosine deaminase [Lentzea albidocapillata]|uniref:Adenosine deaminase n=1 Tax=Lentzea albidocapillata TaxID=40571 RepID=A0A1W2CIB2_9PSEU|nr:adenosine deaminase [Lentzea albidocapillata]SMC84920.1 adenosine deaminase [Lentzea albidocapillata]